MNITLNLDDKMFNAKPQGQEIAAIRKRLGRGTVTISTDELINHIELGKSFTPAAMTGTTGDTWTSQQIIVADIDNGCASGISTLPVITIRRHRCRRTAC